MKHSLSITKLISKLNFKTILPMYFKQRTINGLVAK